MYKMLKVSKEAHKIIKQRSLKHDMTIIDYLDYITNEELNSESFTFIDTTKFETDTLIAIGGDIVMELQKRGLSIEKITLELIEANDYKGDIK